MADTILEVKHLKKYFNTPKGLLTPFNGKSRLFVADAAHIMRIARPLLFRSVFFARFCAVLTSRGERAAFLKVCRIRHQARNRLKSRLAVFNVRKGTEKTFCVWVHGVVEDIFQSSMLNDLSRVYNGDLITDLCDKSQIMGDHDHRGSKFLS